MRAIRLGLFRLIWLLGKGHDAVALQNLALREVGDGRRSLSPDVERRHLSQTA